MLLGTAKLAKEIKKEKSGKTSQLLESNQVAVKKPRKA
jgi:hypothetical protein